MEEKIGFKLSTGYITRTKVEMAILKLKDHKLVLLTMILDK